jgi:hypothetical protein
MTASRLAAAITSPACLRNVREIAGQLACEDKPESGWPGRIGRAPVTA